MLGYAGERELGLRARGLRIVQEGEALLRGGGGLPQHRGHLREVLAPPRRQEVRKVGGFFGIGAKAELWIEMRSNLLREHTTRRVEDFLALRGLLVKSFPFAFMPPLEVSEKQL